MSPSLCQSFGPGLWIFGAGGHAKVVIATLESGGVRASGIFDDDPSVQGTDVLGVPVIGPLPSEGASVDPAAQALVAVGANPIRKAIVKRYPRLNWATAVHRRAVVHQSATLGPGCVVFANAVVQPHSNIGGHSIVNTGAQVDHDCEVGSFAHLAPRSCLGGGVRVGEGAFLGIGCAAAPYTAVGEWAIVGAGAAVVRDLPSHATAVGVPARVIKRHSPPS